MMCAHNLIFLMKKRKCKISLMKYQKWMTSTKLRMKNTWIAHMSWSKIYSGNFHLLLQYWTIVAERWQNYCICWRNSFIELNSRLNYSCKKNWVLHMLVECFMAYESVLHAKPNTSICTQWIQINEVCRTRIKHICICVQNKWR